MFLHGVEARLCMAMSGHEWQAHYHDGLRSDFRIHAHDDDPTANREVGVTGRPSGCAIMIMILTGQAAWSWRWSRWATNRLQGRWLHNHDHEPDPLHCPLLLLPSLPEHSRSAFPVLRTPLPGHPDQGEGEVWGVG